MARAVGIDIGSKSLKILELETNRGQMEVRHFFCLEVPFGDDDDIDMDVLAEPIRKFFRDNRLEHSNINISVPTQDCILREITMDLVQEDHIRKTIKFEAERYLQSYPIEEVIIDFCKLQVLASNKSKVFFTAVPKKVIRRRLEITQACDLDPLNIDLDIMALINLARLNPEILDKENALIVDFGAVSTKLAVLCHGEIRYVRAIRVGSHISDPVVETDQKEEPPKADAPAEDEEIDWELESQLIISLPTPEGIDMGRIVLIKKDKKEEAQEEQNIQEKEQALLQRLIRETRRTMLNLDLEGPLDLICLTGGGSQFTGILESFRRDFDTETILLGFPPHVKVPEEIAEEVSVYGTVALGLAVEMLDKHVEGMSFRQEEFQYTNRFELLKYPLATAVSFLFLLVLIWTYHFQNQRLINQQQYQQLVENAEIIWERNFSEEPRDEVDEFEKISTILYDIDDKIDEMSGDEVPSAKDSFERWRRIFMQIENLRKKGHYVVVNKFTLTPERAIIEGAMQKPELLDSIKQAMIVVEEVDPDDNKTLGWLRGNNTNLQDPKLRQLYRFQIGFKRRKK